MALKARPVVITNIGQPVTPVEALGEPVTVVGGIVAILSVGDEIETQDGGTVTIDAIVNGAITQATYTAP